jgi:ABC-type multidrug transport system fused ATPase/permease subunit
LLVARGGDGGAGDNTAGVLPLLGLYAYAGFRAIPSMHRISMNFNFARFGLAAVENLERDLAYFEAVEGGPDGEPVSLGAQPDVLPQAVSADEIALEKVSFQYEGASTLALDSIDLRVVRGESVGVVGRTGSGKSTLVDLLLGLVSPTHGRVAVGGRDIREALAGWQSQLGYVPQDVYLMDDTLERNVALGFADVEIDTLRVERALARAQLGDFVHRLPDGLQTIVGERGVRLSGGEVQRVAIARALYLEPQLIIFDEATSSLDAATEAEVTAAIERLHADEARVTLVIVSHRISTVARCDRLIFLEQGRLAGEGSYADLVAENSAFRAMLGEA